MVREILSGQMGENIRVIFKKIFEMGTENQSGLMVGCLRVTGKMESNMVRAFSLKKMA